MRLATTLLLAVLCGIASGQVNLAPPDPTALIDVTLLPLTLVSTRKTIGNGRTAGVWTVEMCTDGIPANPLPRQRVTKGATASVAKPSDAIAWMPPDFAADAISRSAADDPRSIFGASIDNVLGVSSDATAIAGFAAGSKKTAIAALSVKAVQIVGQAFKKRAPNPEPYLKQQLPDLVAFPAGGCAPTFYIFASLHHGAEAIHYTLQVPGKAK